MTNTPLQTSDTGIDHQETTPTQTISRTDLQNATPEATATPENPADPYAGLAYGTQEGIFLFSRDGKPKMLIENPDPTASLDAALTADGSQVIYAGPGDVKDLWLADLNSGAKHNLTNTPDRTEFSPQWWSARPDVIVFESRQYIDLNTGRPSRHPDELMQLLQSIRVGGYEQGFDSRADYLRSQFRNNGRQKDPSQQPATQFVSEGDHKQLRL